METLVGSAPVLNWEATDLESSWKSFRSHVDFMFSGPLKEKSEEEQCSYLMLWVGEKGRNIYSTWGMSVEDKKALKNYYENFEKYVKPRSNVIYNRYKFQQCVQGPETFEQFTTTLHVLVKDCQYHNSEEMVRDRIVFGVRSHKIREKLIAVGSDLTLAKALDIARTYELSQAQMKTMSGEDPKVVNVVRNKTKHVYPNKVNERYQASGSSKKEYSQSQKECYKCGYKHVPNKCPAHGKTCMKCKKLNHFASKCKSKMKKVHQITDDFDSDSEEELFIGAVDKVVEQVSTDSDWSVNLKVENKSVRLQVDTGAKCNVISYNTLQRTKPNSKVRPTSTPLKSFSGHTMKPKGTVTLRCEYKGQIHSIEFYVLDQPVPAVLGAETCTKLNIVKRVYSVHEKETFDTKNYSDLFEGLGCLPGTYSIKLKADAKPIVHPPRKVPMALREKVKTELKRMVDVGVIVRQTEPTEWVNSMVTVTKSNGKVRICLDPKHLNEAIQRQHFPMKSIEEVTAQMGNAKIFSKLDLTTAFWQVKLDEESSKLCTFNTPFGRYRFTRMPYGLSSAPEVFQSIMSRMVEDIEGAEAIVDDIIVWGADESEHNERLKQVFKKAEEFSLKLSKDKCEIGKSEVKYVGHLLTDKGVKPDPEKVRAVKAMKRPENVKELMTFLGFIQYLAKFVPRMSEVAAPLRELLEKTTAWHWLDGQEKSFQELKTLAINAPALSYFNPALPITLNVDASSKGLGAVLMQEDKPVAYASRALTTTQQKYAQIEKETLAIVYGCTKFHQYLFGQKFEVESDHRPLQSIFSKPLQKAPSRLQRFLMTLQKYDFQVKYKPGKSMYISDTLSRFSLNETIEQLVPEIEVNALNLTAYLPMSPDKYTSLQKATRDDQVMQILQKTVLEGWPEEKSDISVSIREYWNFRDEISCVDDILYKGHKLIVPNEMREEMLKLVHQSHLGIVKCKSRAREVIFWPGMSAQIEELVGRCETCAQYHSMNQKEPMMTTELPDRPWSKVGADLFQFKGEHYLLTIDYYSKWPEISLLEDLSSSCTIRHMKSQFAKYGIVDELISDNGPQFSCNEFTKFSNEYGFKHTTVSPHYQQANGQAERTVRTMKNLLKKANDPYQALMDYRNTPLQDLLLSPAQLFLGRRLKTSLPTTKPLLQQMKPQNIQSSLQKRQEKQELNYNKYCSKKPLPSLQEGDSVLMNKDKTWVPATVERKHQTPRSYVVKDNTGRKYRRNRKHLRKTLIRAEETRTTECEDSEISTDQGEPARRTQTPRSTDSSSPRHTTRSTDSSSPRHITRSADSTSHQQVTRSGRVVKTPEKFTDYVK